VTRRIFKRVGGGAARWVLEGGICTFLPKHGDPELCDYDAADIERLVREGRLVEVLSR
jgi:hypothetical protein